MKKSMILLGMLSIGYTYAQSADPYEGKVGINTEAPSATLNVKSKTGTDATTKNLELQNANDKKLVTVLDDGKVGIGTETPEVELSVIGGGNFTKGVYAEQTVGGSWLMLHSYGKGLLTNNIRWRNGAYRFVRGTADDTKEGGWLFHNNFNKDTPFLLSVASNEPAQDDDVANLMTILTVNRAGNLGVNTFDATEKLQVEGKIKTSSLAGSGDRIVYADENGVLKTDAANSSNHTSKWINDTTDKVVKLANLSDGRTSRGDNNNVFITEGGAVGIGTKTPAAKFEVNGSGRFSRVDVTGSTRSAWLILNSYGRSLMSSNITWNDGGFKFEKGTDTDTNEGGWVFHSNYNKDTPFLLSVASNEPTRDGDTANMMDILTVSKDGNLGVNTYNATEKLEVAGSIKSSALAGTGVRNVVADASGKLIIGESADTTLKATDTTDQCTADKAGTIHYKEVAISGATNGEKKGVFGFCTKQNGNAIWVYLSNGGNIMQGTGTFGQGL